MGADMIGYIVVGPKLIGPWQQKEAVRKIKLLVKEWNASGKPPVCQTCFVEYSEASLDGCQCDECGTEMPDLELMKTDPERYVREMVERWPPDFRDVATRDMPGNRDKVIVFAGDMTWGDSPEGAGYAALRLLLNSGCAEELGLE